MGVSGEVEWSIPKHRGSGRATTTTLGQLQTNIDGALARLDL